MKKVFLYLILICFIAGGIVGMGLLARSLKSRSSVSDSISSMSGSPKKIILLKAMIKAFKPEKVRSEKKEKEKNGRNN